MVDRFDDGREDIILNKEECLKIIIALSKFISGPEIDEIKEYLYNLKNDKTATSELEKVKEDYIKIINKDIKEGSYAHLENNREKYIMYLNNIDTFTPQIIKWISYQPIEFVHFLVQNLELKKNVKEDKKNQEIVISKYNYPEMELLTREELEHEYVRMSLKGQPRTLSDEYYNSLFEIEKEKAANMSTDALRIFYDHHTEIAINSILNMNNYDNASLYEGEFDLDNNELENEKNKRDLSYEEFDSLDPNEILEKIKELTENGMLEIKKCSQKDFQLFSVLTEEVFYFIKENSSIRKYFNDRTMETVLKRLLKSCKSRLSLMKEELNKNKVNKVKICTDSAYDDQGNEFEETVLLINDTDEINIDEYVAVLQDFEICKDKITEFESIFMNESVSNAIKIYIITQELSYHMGKVLLSKIIKTYPESITNMNFMTYNDKLTFSKMLKIAEFNIPQLMILCDCKDILGEDTLFELFNQSQFHMIKRDINTLIKLKENYSQYISRKTGVDLNKRADEFCKKYLMSIDDLKTLKEIRPRPIVGEYRDRFPEVYKRLFNMINNLILKDM